MTQSEKQSLNQETKNRRWFLRFRIGLKSLQTDRRKLILLIIYIVLMLSIWLFREQIFMAEEIMLFSELKRSLVAILLPLYGGTGLFAIIVAFGTPFGSTAMSNDLRRAGLINHARETPLLVARYRSKNNPRVTILEFEACGIPRSEWENKQIKIEAALNLNVAKITDGKNRRRILLHTVKSDCGLPEVIHWKKANLKHESFVLVLGESLLGPATVNLAHIPHILLGGSTGSGKSVLLKLLLMQCLEKGSIVSIADFKGGVDFTRIWHRKCRMCFDETDLTALLSGTVDELERRKAAFSDAGCPNIDKYNKATGAGLPRLIFACDEVAELLDKNGRSKEDKEQISKIENRLSIIARQGRAFGIHLILATQRPDATILSGQIRNNIDCRVCGRADNVLSQIILDNTAASELIPKDARGRFLLHDGTIFQGYLFDEKSL